MNNQSYFNLNNTDRMYSDLAKLRAGMPAPVAYRTVFNDIADEWGNCSEEERRFIDSDSDYMNANMRYQQQFNAFLLEMVGTQFINSPYGKSAEEVLVSLRQARSRYRSRATELAASVQEENKMLKAELERLKEAIANER